MNIKPKLNLNKHPKDIDNLSLVNAINIKLSHDGKRLMNEESIQENTTIREFIKSKYGNKDVSIKGLIPTNNELIIFTIADYYGGNNDKMQIIRYSERSNNISMVYGDTINTYTGFTYYGGDIKGTFTYNSNNELIISFSNYNVDEEDIFVPLRTINLGQEGTIIDINKYPESLMSNSPEVRIPKISNFEYVKGNAYKGWYYLFIRYKIDNVNYTQWYSIGYPIYIDTIERYSIIKYCYGSNDNLGNTVGCSDYFSNNTDIANETFKINIDINDNVYKKYQIGLICASKTYTKAFKTSDNNITKDNIFIFNKSLCEEYSAQELIIDNYNYFNVKNIINYNNRVYISNYKEINFNKNYKDTTNNIEVRLNINKINIKGLFYNTTITTKNNKVTQYDTVRQGVIPLTTYFNISDNKLVTLSYINNKAKEINITTTAKNILIVPKDYNINGKYTLDNECTIYINNKRLDDIATITGPGTKPVNFKIDNVINTFDCTSRIDSFYRYYNTNSSFNERKSKSTLIPGEVYNFFIHYVDKYGHATNGYRIDNNVKWRIKNDDGTIEDKEIYPIHYTYIKEGSIIECYLALPMNDNAIVSTTEGYTTSYVKAYDIINKSDHTLSKRNLDFNNGPDINFSNKFDSFKNEKYKNFKWYQLITPDDKIGITAYINNNGDRLFKMPIVENSENTIPILNVKFDNITIPNEFVGYYISYEKPEYLRRVTGMLTQSDFRSLDRILNTNRTIERDTDNKHKSNNMLFFSNYFDIEDTIKFDYDLFRIDGINVFDENDLAKYKTLLNSSTETYCVDMNKPQVGICNNNIEGDDITNQCFAMPKYKISVANSSTDNRQGLGTCLTITNSYNLFTSQHDEYNSKVPCSIKIYKITIYNSSRNIYTSNNKTLIRLTDVIYDTTKNTTNFIENGYDGHWSFDGVLVYNNKGLQFDDTNNIAKRFNENNKYYIDDKDLPKETLGFEVNEPFVAYVQYPICDSVFHESRSFKNEPKGIIYFVVQSKDKPEDNKFASGCMVIPINSIDLFKNNNISTNNSNPKTYINYREDLPSVDEFNKTIRRSNIIQDESRVNAWRIFNTDSYKIITENKGNITNLVGIGTILLVHTEHSLFMFDVNNIMQTNNKDVQLTQQDVFDVAYKEVFTSDLGFGGLQDSKSAIIDQFGYIFYNNDFNRFYKFDNGQLHIIDFDIVDWLNSVKLYNVRFANDKFNNRLLIRATFNTYSKIHNITFSYNYLTNTFISFHDYNFTDAVNTKYKLYLKSFVNDKEKHDSIHQFVENEESFGRYDNIINQPFTIKNSSISIIINDSYDIIKYLDFITYKLNKYIKAEFSDNYSPVEEVDNNYSGDYLKIYNNQINTNNLNISIDDINKNDITRFDKPYWQLGNWNFNYLRNNLANKQNYGDAFDITRLYGNYFIVEFTFDNKDGLKIDFESLNYKFSE